MIKINIAKDFSEIPGGRYKNESAFSGEEFRENILKIKLEEAQKKNDIIEVELDGCYGYPSSFLDEAFGGLVRENNGDDVLKYFKFISEDQPGLVTKIENDMRMNMKNK